MTFSYSRCTKGVSFHPDLEIPVRDSYWRGLKNKGLSWVGITCSEEAWHLGRYGFESNAFPAPSVPKWPGVTSWTERANAAGLYAVVRGNYSGQMGVAGLADPSYLEDAILKHAERVAVLSPKLNAFQPVAEWAVEDTPENCKSIYAFYEYMIPKVRKIMPFHTLVFTGPAWAHLPRGEWGMPPLVDTNALWGFDTYMPSDDPARIPEVHATLSKRGEQMMVVECGVQDRSDLTREWEAVAAYQSRALPLKIPCAGYLGTQ